MANILIIDDDKTVGDALSSVVRDNGFDVAYAPTLQEGLQKASSEAFDVVFLDVRMPDGNGLNLLSRIRQTFSSPEVIIITGYGDPDGAELAIERGAWDYIQKPFSIKSITHQLARTLQYREGKKAGKSPEALRREGIVGSSPQMKTCLGLLAQAANSDVNVLLAGETGTGKELFARAIHGNSRRSNKNFVVVDCATLPKTLVESVLLGHVKGAYTDADRAQEGLIKQADGGTLFLDEVGELPMSVQKAFLRVLQERRFRPVGGRGEIESDFRLVTATNRDLDKMMQDVQFRNDLLFRLRSFTIDLPTLRGRGEDIKELALFHTVKLCERYGMETKGFSPEFLEVFVEYDWPGNVRELVNTLDSAIAMARDGPILFCKHLPTRIRIQVARASVAASKKTLVKGDSGAMAAPCRVLPKYRDFRGAVLAEAENEYFQNLMSLANGSVKEACRISGLGRTRLYTLMKKNGISRLGWPSSNFSS